MQRLRAGDLISVQSTKRDAKTGRLTRVDVVVIDAKGRQRTFTLRGKQLTQARIDELADKVDASGAVFSYSYPLRGLRALEQEPEDVNDDDLDVAA